MRISLVLGAISVLSAAVEASYASNPAALVVLAASAVGAVSASSLSAFRSVYDLDNYIYCNEFTSDCLIAPNKLTGHNLMITGNHKYQLVCDGDQPVALLATEAGSGLFKRGLEGGSRYVAPLKDILAPACVSSNPKEALHKASFELAKLESKVVFSQHLIEGAQAQDNISHDLFSG